MFLKKPIQMGWLGKIYSPLLYELFAECTPNMKQGLAPLEVRSPFSQSDQVSRIMT